MGHKHFTIDERESILEYLTLNFSKSKIAKKLVKHSSSVGIELKEILKREKSDKGFYYTTPRYQALLFKNDIAQSLFRKEPAGIMHQ